jgi:hypothetical protein
MVWMNTNFENNITKRFYAEKLTKMLISGTNSALWKDCGGQVYCRGGNRQEYMYLREDHRPVASY